MDKQQLSKSDPVIAEVRKLVAEFCLAGQKGDMQEMNAKNEAIQELLQRVRKDKTR